MRTRSSRQLRVRTVAVPVALLTGLLVFDACATKSGVRGRVVDAEGAPIVGALVTARSAASPMRHASISDDRGRFRIEVQGALAHEVVVADPRFRSPAATATAGGATIELRATPIPEAERLAPSAEWLALLPAGELKPWFILDCTGCHQFNETRARKGDAPRTAEQWNADAARMHQMFGPESGFPIVSGHLAGIDLGEWLATAVAKPRTPLARGAVDSRYTLTEYDLPGPDLPHDLAVDAAGRVLVTGMFTNRILILDPSSGKTEAVEIPIEHANPRAIEIDRSGNWWTLLGAAQRIARYEPAAKRWTSSEIGFYGHSIALDRDGGAWANDHFARSVPKLARVAPTAENKTELSTSLHAGEPFHSAAKGPSPIPYELRAAPDGRVWISLLHGNEIVSFDPATGAFDAHRLPDPDAGPRRFDIDARGDLWIPGYASSTLYRFDPESGVFERFPLPVPDALPYVVRVDPGSGDLWIGTGAADALFRFEPKSRAFTAFPVATRGATMRHLAVDARNGDVWVAYGASPAIHPTRVARLRRNR